MIRAVSHELAQRCEVGAGAQRGHQVYLVVAQQAEPQLAVGRQAEAVAACAERFSDTADKA